MTATTYADCLRGLYGLTRFGEKLSLDGPRALNEYLGNPLEAYRSVLVGGTNGKGSTCAFLEILLRAEGLRTGLFTSPHLNSFTERVRIDGTPVPRAWVAEHAGPLIQWADRHGGSFFEAAWGLAARAFSDFQIDVAIWEVGLGGRLDATNVAEPEVSAITTIGLDHTHVLGETLDAIAGEKAAIFRPDRPALTSARGAGLQALKRVCSDRLNVIPALATDYALPLPGLHQRRNAGLAMAVADALGHRSRPEHLLETVWEGRGETMGNVTLDCAHNPQAMAALVQWYRDENMEPPDVFFGAMLGKDIQGMARQVESFARSITLVTPDYPRRIPAQELASFFESDIVIGDSIGDALDRRDVLGQSLVCGSGFLVAEARAHLLDLPYPECGIRTQAR